MKVSSKLKYYIRDARIKVMGVIDGKFKSVDVDMLPYAFVEERGIELLQGVEGVVSIENNGHTDEYGNKVVKVICSEPKYISRIRMMLGESGINTYECYDEETEILTIDGWKRWYEINEGDLVASVDMENLKLVYVPVKTVHIYDYEGELIRIGGKFYDLLVTPNHWLWFADGKGSAFRIEAEKYAKMSRTKKYKLGGRMWRYVFEYDGYDVDLEEKIGRIYTKDGRLSKKYVQPDYSKKKEWFKIFGWWVAEGSIDGRYVIFSVNYRDDDEINEVVGLLESVGLNPTVSRSGTSCNVVVSHKLLAEFMIKEFGRGSKSKKIPKWVKFANKEYLEAFVEGLMKGDGYLENGKYRSLTTSSETLANDLQEVLFKLGYGAIIKKREQYDKRTGKTYVNYAIYISKERGSHTDDIEYVRYKGKVWDVTVEPYHTVVVRRNGKIVISGNSDIPFVFRLIYDKYFTVGYNSNQIAFVDIEVWDKDGMPRNGEKQIMSIAVYDIDGNAMWFYINDYPTEEVMLRSFISYLKRTGKTIFTSWNVQFDYDYLMARCDKLGIDSFYLSLMHAEDMLGYYKQIVKGLPSYKLEYVAEYEGIASKIKRDKLIADMTRDELYEYNMRDAYIIWQIELKHFLIQKLISMANTFNVTIDMLNATRLWDCLTCRRARELSKVLRNKGSYGDHVKYEGALVIEPKVGLWENVLYLDVESLYPNVLMNKNIDIGNFNGVVMPHLIRQYFELRRKYKKKRNGYPEGSPEYIYYDLLQFAYKIVINSGYGIFGTPHFRYYDPNKALAITQGGQEVLKTMIEFIENDLELTVVYGDTDSTLLLLGDANPASVEHLINMHIYPYRVKIEHVFEKFILVKSAGSERAAKKRYIGLTTDGKIVYKGVELRRGDAPELTKIVMQHVIDMIFAGKSKYEIYDYLTDIEKRMRRGEFNEQLIISVGVKDNIEDYKTMPPHVRAYDMALKQGYHPVDNTIQYVYANGDVVPITPLTNISELVFNYNYYWDMYIMRPISRILSSVYTKQTSLDSFIR